VTHIRNALKPGGVLAIHEYFNYATWQIMLRSRDVEEFVNAVMKSWRDDGGEPDIGMELPHILEENGFEVTALNPIIDIVCPANFIWQWPKAFIEVGLARLTELGYLTPERARTIGETFVSLEATPHVWMITPAVLEIIATRR
jgi:hypothetical protein